MARNLGPCLYCGESVAADIASVGAIGNVYTHIQSQRQKCEIVDAYAEPANGDRIFHVTVPVMGLIRAKDENAAAEWLATRVQKRGFTCDIHGYIYDRSPSHIPGTHVFESEPVDYNSVENPVGDPA